MERQNIAIENRPLSKRPVTIDHGTGALVAHANSGQVARQRPRGPDKLPRVSRHLDRFAPWMTELRTVYKEARQGAIPLEQATRLTYIIRESARLIRMNELSLEVQALRRELERIGVDTSHVASSNYLAAEPEDEEAA